MYYEKTSNKKFTVATIVVGVFALAFFTLVTLGLARKSDAKVVASAAKTNDFKDGRYFALIPKSVMEQSNAHSLSQRLIGSGSQRLICSLTNDQFSKLINVDGTKVGMTKENERSLIYVVVDKDASASSIDEILNTDKYGTAMCKDTKDSDLFLFYTPTSVS